MDNKTRIYAMPFAKIYPLYVSKVTRKGHTKQEVDELIFWLTGHNAVSLEHEINNKTSLEGFFTQAPHLNPARKSITGVICGIRVEDIKEPVMQEIRYLDKLVDELARGKDMAKIKRSNA